MIFERTANGWSAYVPDLPGLGVAGESKEGVRKLASEAIVLHIDALREDGLAVPLPSAVEFVEVAQGRLFPYAHSIPSPSIRLDGDL